VVRSILIITGELSGFNYAKELLPALSCNFKIYGVFPQEVEGAERIFDSARLTSFGLFEALGKLPEIVKALRTIKVFLEKKKPSAVLLVDFPGFNLKVAEYARRCKSRVFYFIPPKLWAWGSWRIEKIKRVVDRVFVVFPFEVEFYRKRGVNVTYVGNPLKDMVKPTRKPDEFVHAFNLSHPLIAILPGSRMPEVKAMLKPMLKAVKGLNGSFAIPVAQTVQRKFVERCVEEVGLPVKLIPQEERFNLMFASDTALVVSGTASLECAIAGLPHVVIYKLNLFTYAVAKRLVKIKHVSLPNIISGRELVPELLQRKAVPLQMREKLVEVLAKRKDLSEALRREVADKLTGGAINRLAEEITKELE